MFPRWASHLAPTSEPRPPQRPNVNNRSSQRPAFSNRSSKPTNVSNNAARRQQAGPYNANHAQRGDNGPGLYSAVAIPPAWQQRRSALVLLTAIPNAVTAWDILSSLREYGNIVYVELDDVSKAPRKARVRFEPPPHSTVFHSAGHCKITFDKNAHTAWPEVEFPGHAEEATIRTPTGNSCPEFTTLDPFSLTFGIPTGPETVVAKRELRTTGFEHPVKFIIDFKRKKAIFYFPVRFSQVNQYYRADIKFGNINKIHRVDLSGDRSAVVISAHGPPLFWRKRGEKLKELSNQLVLGDHELWQRAVEINQKPLSPPGPISLDEDYQFIDLGRWTALWICLDRSSTDQWLGVEKRLKDWNIKTKVGAALELIPDKKPQLWKVLDPQTSMPILESRSRFTSELALLGSPTREPLPFDVRYQLEVCISHGILSEYNLNGGFIEKLVEFSKVKTLNVNRARLILEYAADKGNPVFNPMELFENASALQYLPATANLPSHCALIRKAIVTPTRIYYNTPTVETTNRVIRHYNKLQDNFIRVQFTDELAEGRITGCEGYRDDLVYSRAYRVLDKGIRMGSVHWEFLAFGNSQVRENGAFFFCKPEGNPEDVVTCNKIREWMGRFNHITVVAKYAARIGQCFSTTRPVPTLIAPRIVKTPDIERGGCCFTDGVGKISSILTKMVADDWKIWPSPSAVQFRMGGCKGVLVSWPEVKGTEVHIRKSQEKFLAEYNGLEVIRCSQFSCATLNRQTISILSCLGVRDQIFVDMMNKQVAKYNTAMTDSSEAADLLSRYVDENQMTKTIAGMVLNGFMKTREPFVDTLLQLWRSWSIKALKEKARLIVEKGAFVLGCVDETGSLRGHSKAIEGKRNLVKGQLPQIFLQVSDPDNEGHFKVITGLCAVGRNPSLHPGDIRVVEAVDIPALRHIKDVVVFPLKGDRDVPSMCSGGDLDGDDFFVLWDQQLLPLRSKWGHPPMDYTPLPPIQEKGGVKADNLKQFFVLYMKNNTLPLIAHAHLAMADTYGADHAKCLELANLHSMAVDYVKTGVSASWDKSMEPRKWPHFMEKNPRASYNSTTALGQLYDMVKKEVFDVNEGYKLPFDSRVLKRYHLSNDLLKKTRRIKCQYDIAMRRVMGQLEIGTEFEVWTTFVLSKPRTGSSYKLQEKVGQESYTLKKQFRDLCIQEAGGSREIETFRPFVAAMYQVTWEEVQIALYESRQPHIRPNGNVGLRRISARSMPLISFPWLFDSVLGDIAGDTPAQGTAASAARKRPPQLETFTHAANDTEAARPASHEIGGKREVGDADMLMNYIHTSDGLLIHRGEILHLFHHDGDGPDVDEPAEAESVEVEPVEVEPVEVESAQVELALIETAEVGSAPAEPSQAEEDEIDLIDLEPLGADDESAQTTSVKPGASSATGVALSPPASSDSDLLGSDGDANNFTDGGWAFQMVEGRDGMFVSGGEVDDLLGMYSEGEEEPEFEEEVVVMEPESAMERLITRFG
ncbi:RNA dependent RNA polymerase-domain-containing protein [Lasiosphaeria hispida]|uniref:RNA-dependent RNA polymerase n=1 Tax=Lasiosphaeria hispida TaxID=260671 RepID=A0AAJ0MKH8_9PEZI|nr:RNA dependent RNA polymerase-domain-containing protein [Lasiosphaeria hispida]